MSQDKEELPHLDIESNLGEIWNLLRSLDKKIDVHLAEEAVYKPQMIEAVKTIEKSKGVVNFIRFCFLVGGSIAACYAWFKSHITFHP